MIGTRAYFHWTPADIARLRALAGEGLSAAAIARAMSDETGHPFTQSGIVKACSKHAISTRGESGPPCKVAWTDDQIATIRRWADEGLSVVAMAARLAGEIGPMVTRHAVRGLCERLSIPLRGREGCAVWDEAAIEQVRQLAGEGKSASAIAGIIGHHHDRPVSKSQIIGLVHRRGITLKGKGGLPAGTKLSRPTRPSTPRAPRQVAPPAPRAADLARAAAKAADAAHSEAAAYDAAAGRLALVEMTRTQCRFYIGDPLEEGGGFCGADVEGGGAWCAHHRLRVYRPPTAHEIVRLKQIARRVPA